MVALNAIAFGAMILARWWAARNGIVGSPLVGAWATAVGALCAFRDADANVDAQAAAVRMVARDLKPTGNPLLKDYVAATIAEWPTLCGGGRSAAADAALEREAQPKTQLHADDLFAQLATLEALRFAHMRAADERLPRELWAALGVLSLALLAVLALALPESQAYHLALMLVMGTSLAILFWVATLLDYPFCGTTSVVPNALVEALHLATP
jgi:hypothetical protein